jgi:uncharacterized damage-inducible protein DinB
VLPVTLIDGTHTIVGFKPAELKKALKIGAEIPRDLSATELLEKFRIVFAAARRAVLQIPNDQLDWKTPENERRGQTLRATAWHLFDRPEICMDAVTTNDYSFEGIHQYERRAEEYRTTQEIAAYADEVLVKLEHFLTHESEKLDVMVDAYFGKRTVGQLLNLTLSSMVLRLKQTYHFMQSVGVEPQGVLNDADFPGMIIPKKLFG